MTDLKLTITLDQKELSRLTDLLNSVDKPIDDQPATLMEIRRILFGDLVK